MRTIITLLLAFVILTSFIKAVNINADSFKIDDNYKVEGTFSGNTKGENSFHLVIARNKKDKNYLILPYQFKDNQITEMKAVVFEEKPSVLSFHNNDDQLSIITSLKVGKSKKFKVVDIDLKTGVHNTSGTIDGDDYKTTLREKNKNFLVFSKKESLKIIEINNAKSIQQTNLKANATNKEFFKSLSKSNLEAINSQGFVKNGSISDFRIYSNDGTITITKENIKDESTSVAQIKTNTDFKTELSITAFKSNGKDTERLKKSTSYISDNKLFQMSLRKKSATLDIHNLRDGSNQQIDLLGSTVANFSSNKTATNSFLKNATKNRNQPTVTVNQAENGNLKLRIDYVNKNTYNYNYNWWWHHHWMMQNQMWMMQQQQNQRMIQNSLPKFGPNASEAYPIYTEKTKSDSFFEIGITSNGDPVAASDVTTIYRNIDKKKYVNEVDENKKLKHSSTVFTETAFRYISYNKKTKSFSIKSKMLK